MCLRDDEQAVFFPAQSHKPDEGSGSPFSLIVKIKQTYSGNAQRDTRLKMNIYCEQKTMKPRASYSVIQLQHLLRVIN